MRFLKNEEMKSKNKAPQKKFKEALRIYKRFNEQKEERLKNPAKVILRKRAST